MSWAPSIATLSLTLFFIPFSVLHRYGLYMCKHIIKFDMLDLLLQGLTPE